MLNKLVTIFILALTVCACNLIPQDHLKRSANNKLFDSKGFKGSKRAPLYNKKYIAQAKKNVMIKNYDEDEDEEYEDAEIDNPVQDNIEMYKAMIQQDLSNERHGNKSAKPIEKNKHIYPSLIESKDKSEINAQSMDAQQIQQELEKIKLILQETKQEMAKSKCPAARQKENDEYNSATKENKTHQQKINNPRKAPESPNTIPDYEEAVKSL